MKVRTRRPRKLLSASLGVAAVSYVACGGSSSTGAPPPVDGATVGNPFDVVANLVVAPVDAGPDRGTDAPVDAEPDRGTDAPSDVRDAARDSPPSFFDVVANLVIVPRDATSDTAGDATDSGGSPFDVVANLVAIPLDGRE